MNSLDRFRFALLLLAAVAVLLVLRDMLRSDASQRNWEYAPDMAYSPAYDAYTPNPNLPGGGSLQPLVAGVVPRGATFVAFGPGEEEALRAGRELRPPADLDEEALARGAVLYRQQCTPCHAADGSGTTPVTARGMLPPPSLLAARARALPDGQLFHVLTHGQGNMAGYAAQLTVAERWQVVTWLRKLQEQTP